MKTHGTFFAACFLAAMILGPQGALAQNAAAPNNAAPATASETPQDQYSSFIHRAGHIGPQAVELGDQAVLNLPQGFAFLPEKIVSKMMEKMGNKTGSDFIGLIVPEKEDNWFISVDFIPAGYVKDDDAKTWDGDELLNSIRENTEAANKERSKQGVPGLEVVGWAEKPHYDETTHRLIWSVDARAQGNSDSKKDLINYRTLMLGREGYLSMNLVTDLGSVEAQKPISNLLMSNLTFSTGKKYADFNAATDHVAEYGLAALVVGIAAKKLGFFAIAAAFAAKFVKIGILAAIGYFASLRKKLSRKKAAASVPTQQEQPPKTDV